VEAEAEVCGVDADGVATALDDLEANVPEVERQPEGLVA
jgi:hypothetical protein